MICHGCSRSTILASIERAYATEQMLATWDTHGDIPPEITHLENLPPEVTPMGRLCQDLRLVGRQGQEYGLAPIFHIFCFKNVATFSGRGYPQGIFCRGNLRGMSSGVYLLESTMLHARRVMHSYMYAAPRVKNRRPFITFDQVTNQLRFALMFRCRRTGWSNMT